MTLQLLPLPEGTQISVGSSVEVEAKVLKAPFGNGYVFRTADGFNSVKDTYQVMMEEMTREEALVIHNFLKARKGAQAFLWTPPGEATPRKWLCEKWSRQHVSAVHDTVSATFEECFDP